MVAAGWTVLNMRPSLDEWPYLKVRDQPSVSGLTLRFIGASSVVLTDGTDTLVVDGFVTRPSLPRLMFAKLRPDEARIKKVRTRTGVETLQAIMVGHSHYDHAMDAAEWVRQAGGEIWGTESTQTIAQAEGIHAVRVVKSGDALTAGAFSVRFFELDHAPPERMGGTIDPKFRIPARVRDYKTGGGLGFYTTHGACRILVVPSAGKPHADLRDYPADIVLLSIGQLGLQDPSAIETYWRDTVTASGARLVIPIHWDDFTRSLDKPLKPLPYAVERVDLALSKLAQLASEQQGDEVVLALPVLFEPLDLSAFGNC